jgi:pimeloyl-ACP methyl ester carboxylesterase
MPDPNPILIVGGFGSNWPQYSELQSLLHQASGRPVGIVPITLLDWAGVVASDSYGALLRTLDQALRNLLQAEQATQAMLVAHSAGGVLARIYLGDQPYSPRKLCYNGFQRVSSLVTLGTPHSTNRSGRQGGLNQVQFVQTTYPGAYWRFIHYISVMGRGIFGQKNGPPPERGAFQSYRLLSGEGAQWGDGVVPLPNGLLDGSTPIVLDGLRHDPRPDRPWYGQDLATVQSWWQGVAAAERMPTPGIRV